MDTITFNGQRFKLIPISDEDAEEALSFQLLETLVEPYLEYAEYIADKKPSTIKNYKHTISRFFTWQRDNSRSNIGGQHWVDYYIDLKKRGLSAHTIRNHRNDLKVFADWLIKDGYISQNPLLTVKPPKPPKNPPLRAISSTVEQKMLDCANAARDYALLMLFRTSGCRISDIVNKKWIMKWSDMNITSRSAVVLGKGDKYRPLFFTPKTALAIERYRQTLPNTGAGEAVWVGERGPLSRSGVYQIFKRIAIRAEVKEIELWSPHTWRHRWARTLDDNGMTTPKLQYLLGHASMGTTEIYTRPETMNIQADYDRCAKFD